MSGLCGAAGTTAVEFDKLFGVRLGGDSVLMPLVGLSDESSDFKLIITSAKKYYKYMQYTAHRNTYVCA